MSSSAREPKNPKQGAQALLPLKQSRYRKWPWRQNTKSTVKPSISRLDSENMVPNVTQRKRYSNTQERPFKLASPK
jgi:hypothetical protein